MKTYQVLIVEDQPADAELIELYIGKAQLDIRTVVVQTQAEIKKALNEGWVDLVISDYNLDNFTGHDVLKVVKKHSSKLPFILVSGYLGEKKAIEIMADGADDFVLKEELDRLPPVVKRELENYRKYLRIEQEKNMALYDLQERVKEQKCLYKISHIDEQPLSIADLLSTAVDMLPGGWQYPTITAARIEYNGQGYQTNNFTETPWSQTATKKNSPLVLHLVYLEEKPERDMGPFLKEEQYLINSILDILSLKINRILDKKELVHKQELLEKANDLAKIGNWEVDLKTGKMSWSSQVYNIHEVDQSYEPTVEDSINFYKEGHHRESIIDASTKSVQEGKPYDVELIIVTAKGNERWVRAIGKPIIKNGECVKLYGSFQDIDKQKKTELELRSIEQKLRDIIEHATNLFYRHDTHHKLTYVSPQFDQFFGFPPDEAIQSSWTNFMTDHPVNKKGIELAERAIKTGKSQDSYILQLRKRDDAIIWVRVNEAPIVEQGKAIAMVGSLTDITSLQMVIEEQEILSKVASETDNMVLITDLDGQITWINDAFARQTGYRLDEIKGKNPALLLSGPKTDPKTAKYIEHKLNNLESVNVEIIQYTKASVPYWAEVDIAPIKDEVGDVFRYFFIQKDITEQKEMLAHLEEEKERLKQAQRIGKIGDWEYDLETGKVTWSAMLYDIFDRDPALDAPSYEQNMKYYFEQKEFFKESVRLCIEEATPYSFDIMIKTEKDKIKYVHLEGTPSLDQDGKVEKLYGIVQDITERKDYLNRLKKKRESLEEAQEIGKIGDWDHDIQTDEIFWSDQLFKIFDRDPKLGAPNFEDLLKYFPEDRDYYAKEVQKARENDSKYSVDLWLRIHNGERKYIHAEGHPKYNELGKFTGLHGIVQDITERKEHELQNVAKEKQLHTVTENAEVILYRYILKPDGTDQMFYISDSIKKIFGVSVDEALQSTEIVWNQIHEKDIRRVRDAVQQSAETLTTWDCRFRILTLSGEVKWVLGRGNPTKLEDGSIQWDSIIIDITDQVQQERLNEALVQEVHHRVKNNLAIITGFLELQLDDLEENSQERLTLERAVTRIYSIAEVHKLLYEGAKLMDIDVREYMDHLVDHVTDTLKIDDTFTVELQINDLHMNVNELTPLGMLINELLTNSMKYAFSDDNQGKITIRIAKEDDTYEVFYKDNGPDIDPSSFEKAQTSGLNIAKILLAQLEADFELLNKDGFSLSFTFKERSRGAHGNLRV